jgi:predicted nucleotide-binding protein
MVPWITGGEVLTPGYSKPCQGHGRLNSRWNASPKKMRREPSERRSKRPSALLQGSADSEMGDPRRPHPAMLSDTLAIREVTFLSNEAIFIASATEDLAAANLVKSQMVALGYSKATVWNEGIFCLTHTIFEQLLTFAAKFDFAILIWGGDDITISRGQSLVSPNDNVVFEAGLFLGALGKERVFVFTDKTSHVQIPSDFAGVLQAVYDGSLVKSGDIEGVKSACEQVAREIERPRYQEFLGDWRSRYLVTPEADHREVTDEVVITPSPSGIVIASKLPERDNKKIPEYIATGRIRDQQVVGTWQHKSGKDFVWGVFILVVTPLADLMCGYCTGRDVKGALIFSPWILVKKNGKTPRRINQLFHEAQRGLAEQTLTWPFGSMA